MSIDNAGMRPPSPSQRRPPLSAQPSSSDERSNMHPASPQRTLLQQNVQNKLRQLEQLQYDLTKQVVLLFCCVSKVADLAVLDGGGK